MAGWGMTEADTRAREAARLHVLNSLPQRHADYFYAEVRQLCARSVRRSESSSEASELFSEVMAKLLGITRVDWSAGERVDGEIAFAAAAHEDPNRDGRVEWLLSEIGGMLGLKHRKQDIWRWLTGGKPGEGGTRFTQLEPKHVETWGEDAVEPHHVDDVRLAWLGLLELAKSVFQPEEDAAILLRLIATDSEIRDAFSDRWPIGAIMTALNRSHPSRPWTDDRVENAKRRLMNWIGRLGGGNGLDQTDAMALLARHARNTGQSPQGVSAVGSRRRAGAS